MYTSPDKQIYGDSETYKNWMSTLSLTTCENCFNKHGTIYLIDEPPYEAMLHPKCNCSLVPMRTKKLGYVTQDRWNGADVFIACYGMKQTSTTKAASATIPEFYIQTTDLFLPRMITTKHFMMYYNKEKRNVSIQNPLHT